MAGALEIMHARARAEAAERKNAGGAPENKSASPRLPGLALPSSRYSSKGARRLSIEAKLTEADFAGATPSGQQDRFTIEDVEKIVAAKRKAGA